MKISKDFGKMLAPIFDSMKYLRKINGRNSLISVTPLNIRLLGAHQPLSAGKRYDLLCQSAGSRPSAVITWWRDGQRLEKTTETVNLQFLIGLKVLLFVEK